MSLHVAAARVEESDDLEGALWELWADVVRQACSIAEHGELVEQVVALRDRPAVGEVWGLTVWSDLPVLGAQLREAWSWAAPPETTDDTWPNLNAFAARLAVAGFDTSLLGLWSIRSALERPDPTPQDLAAARLWFDLAGDLLATWSSEHRTFAGLDAPGFGPERLARWAAALEV